MKVELISISQRDYNFGGDNLGTARLAAYLKQNGWDVIQTYLYMDNDFDKEIDKIDINGVYFGFAVYSDTVDYANKVVSVIKAKNEKAICFAGSKFVTLYYKKLYQDGIDFDFVTLGDGEVTLHHMLEHLEAGGTIEDFVKGNNHVASSGYLDNKYAVSYDINELPWPDRSFFINRKQALTANICDSHGCYGNCTFCGLRHDRIIKSYRSAKDIWNEIRTINEQFSIRLFLFTGGSFELAGDEGKARINEFCDYVLESGLQLSFRCFLQSRAFTNTKEDKLLLKKMKTAGFNYVLIGIEAGCDSDLRTYNKPFGITENKMIMSLMREAHIYAEDYGFIMFQPYSTIDGIRQNYEFLRENRCAYLKKNIDQLFVLDGTKIYDDLAKDGLLKNSFNYNHKYDYHLKQYDYHFKNKDVSVLFDMISQSFMQSKVLDDCFWFTSLGYVFYLVEPLLDLDKESNEIESITNELYHCFVDFFGRLYIDLDYSNYMKRFEQLVEKITPIYKRCNILRRKILVKYYKHNNRL